MGKRRKVKTPSSVMIATFSLWKGGTRTASNGILDPMMYFFKPRVKRLVLLDQPYPGSDRIAPLTESYSSGKLKKKVRTGFTAFILSPILNISNKPGTHLSFKLRDLFSVLEAGFKSKEKFELFIGLESINAIGGIILRKFGRVNKVVYYISDYSPKRFQSKLLNDIYLWMDRFCAKNADFIWDVSLAMHPARIKAGLNKKESAPEIHVPNALYKEQIDILPLSKREPYSLLFVGTLGLENGPDIAVKAMPYIVKKFPKALLHIFGGGGKGFEEDHLKKLSKKLNVEKNVKFHGFISDQNELSNTIKHYQVALAPYKHIEGSIRLYGDATKLRLYMASGIPVVSTKVPPLGRELAEKDAAIIVKDSPEDLAEGIIKLLKEDKLYERLAKNAADFAKDNLWENTYENTLIKMGY